MHNESPSHAVGLEPYSPEEYVENFFALVSPSHTVGLERLLFRIAKEELVESPSHAVGLEQR